MKFEFYGAVIALIAVAMMPLVARMKKRLSAITPLGWGKLHFALSLFLAAGLLLLLAGVPQLMTLFMPAVVTWFKIAAMLLVALAIGITIWSVGNIASGVRRIQRQQSDEEGWQQFYAHLQEMALQPFSFVEILNMSLKQLMDRSEANGAAVLLFKENSSELILAAFSGISPETAKRLERLQVSGDIFGRAQKLGQPQLVSNLSDSDKMTEALFANTGYLSAAVFPLRSQDKTTGSVALLSTKPFHFAANRARAIGVAASFLATVLTGVRREKELTRLRDKLRPSEEAKRITEELFFRRGFGGDLQLREAVEFERVRKFFDADCIKLVARDSDGEFRIKASSGGAETGLKLEQRKLTGINRAVNERKLLLMTSPQSKPAGGGYDSMSRQVLFVPVPYPDRNDLVLLLESETASLQFSKEKLSAVRVASVYLADLHFLFLEKRKGERYRNSIVQAGEMVARITGADSDRQIAGTLGEAAALFLPGASARVVLLKGADGSTLRLRDSTGVSAGTGGDLQAEGRMFAALGDMLLQSTEDRQQLSRSNIVTSFPIELQKEANRALAKLPDAVSQYVFSIRDEQTLHGVAALYFASENEPADESLGLYRRLTELAGVQLNRLQGPATAVEAPGLSAEQLHKLNDVVTGIVVTAQLLEDGAAKEELPERYVEGLEKISSSAVRIGALITEFGDGVSFENAESAGLTGESAAPSLSLDDWLGEHQVVSSEPTLGIVPDQAIADGIKTLVSSAFENDVQGKLYLSALTDAEHTYYQLSSAPVDADEFHRRVTADNNWTACERASSLPGSLRSLVGEVQIVSENGEMSTLIWRVPRARNEKGLRGKLRILGIDDQEAIRELLNNIITGLGHKVTTVADSGEALALLGRELYDVVIVEVALPGQSGWEIARQVKAQSPMTPVIMLSGWDYQESAVGDARRHADFVLTKPFKMEQLRQAIADAAALISR